MTFQTGGSQKADTSVIAAYSLMTFPNVLYEELKIFSYGNHAEINSCVLLVDKKDGFWRRKGSRLRKRRIEGGEWEKRRKRKGGGWGKRDALLEAPCHEILIIYLHGYQEPSHCLYILLYHYSSIFTFWSPRSDSVPSLLFVSSLSFSLFSLYYEVLFLLDFILLSPALCLCLDHGYFCLDDW